MSKTEAMSFDEALASGDPDAIEAAMAVESGEDPGVSTQQGSKGDNLSTEGDELAVDPEIVDGDESLPKEESTDEPGGDAEAADDDTKKVVLTKDGKHEIPYAVLENQRKLVGETQQALSQSETTAAQLQDQLTESKKQLTVLKGALEKSGVTLPKDFSQLTEEDLDTLSEDYEEVGPVIKALHNQVKELKDQLRPDADVTPTDNPSTVAVKNNPDLNTWMTDDPDRWGYANTVDDTLRQDPTWKDKSLQERFEEVAKRTKVAFGDVTPSELTPGQVKAAAQEKINAADAEQAPPTSLSEMGKPSGQERSTIERLADIDDPNELHDRLAQNPALLDQIYAQLE